MLTDFKYKDCRIAVIENKKDFTIRLSNQFGFRWFQTDNLKNGYLKAKRAWEIESEIIQNVFGKWYGMHPIKLN